MSRLKCLDPGIGRLIGAYEFGLLKAEDRAKFERHVTRCSYCFNELYSDHPLIESLKANAPKLVGPLQRMPKEKAKGVTVDRFFSFLTLKQWAWATGMIVGLSVLTIYYMGRPRPADFGSGPEIAIERGLEIYQPQGEIREIPREFQWQRVPGAAYYEVEIYDPEEKSLWQARGDSNALTLSEEPRRLLARAGEYFWEVRAYAADNTLIIKSQRIRFRLRLASQGGG